MSERMMTPEEQKTWRVDRTKQCAVLLSERLPFDSACLMPMPCERHAHLTFVARLADAEARAEAAEATVQRVTEVVLARPICYGCFAPDHPCGDPVCDLDRAIREALRGDQ